MITEELDELLDEAYEHLRNGRYRMALTAAKKVYEQKPYDFRSACCLAWATLENGNPHQALELANQAVQTAADNVDARLYRGFLLMRMSIFEGAISDLDWAISKNPDLIVWAHLNKARALAGLGRYFEGLEEIDRAIELDKLDRTSGDDNKKLKQVRDWFKITLGYEEGFFGGLFNKKKSYIEEADEAFKQKEYWFSLWAARDILNSPSLTKEHDRAHLLELDALLAMFQTVAAYEKAEHLKERFKDNPKFENIYQKILKFHSPAEIDKDIPFFEPEVELINPAYEKKTELIKYPNSFFNVFSVKTYDLLENLRTEKRTYLLQFNEETIRYIGVEIIIDNPFFGNKKVIIDGLAVWYLNNVEVGRHQFELGIEKEWKTVEFVQSWGTDNPGFWSSGQGKVDIYLANNKICTRWFLIGHTEIVNFEEAEVLTEAFVNPEKPATTQPNEVQLTSLKPHETESLDYLLAELDSYVGLNSVKQSMRDFVDYLKFINERKKLGLKTEETISMNSVFLGKPGTGKTTIARLLGKIFKAMGILQNGHVIEVDRSGLVGQFIGETAQKTDKVINEAVGGLLFIDEAYTLKKAGNQQDFGQEAIDVLLKRMDDKAGQFVIIAAGYPDEMTSFINSSPGLKSRFTRFFQFEDYSPDELTEIFKGIAGKEDYQIEPEALDLLKKEFTRLYRIRDHSFGNARLVRNIFNDAKVQHGKNFLRKPAAEKTKEALTTITKEDIQEALKGAGEKKVTIGINEESLSKVQKKLDSLIGLSVVKDELSQLIKLARFYHERNENLQDKFSAHYVFLGNPGTGKTTVARLFGELYSALGILPKGHLVEVDRQTLVGSFIGQTAEKTKQIIDKAIGGTLLIDEAYSLVKKGDSGSDFGKEAIDTLLKRMEDDRGKFIVIAAGYTDEMNDFLESNPGLKSRFTKKIVFDDYSPDELMAITAKLIEEKGHILHEDAVESLRRYYFDLFRSRDKSFGNARIARDLVEATLKKHLLRVADISSEERKENDIKFIRLIDFKDVIAGIKEKQKVKIEGNPELLDEYLKELTELTGLESVKKSVDKLVSSLKVAKLREQRGLKVIPKNLHSVFMGNPGTGKTTVARLLSKIYKEMGILEKGHLVEVDRSNLVAGYQGQTATKTDAVIQKAMGGTLFIDEAYSLARGSKDFGQEAIDTLLKRMEDYQGKFVVIVAGYTGEMRDFVESNPGLQSRFTNYFTYDDYTPRQLLEIALVITEKSGYKLDEGAWQLLLEIFTDLYNRRDKSFGNARMVRNILYKAISNQEERVLTLYDLNNEDLSTITIDDVGKIDLNEITQA